ncbi:MAG: cytochrome c [Gammaproteobacteria bacterium]|nr:cytochrome c [Gammaproteobacteria bacterium]
MPLIRLARVLPWLGLLLWTALPVQAQGERFNDEPVIARGKTLFQEHCAVCHGANAQGIDQNWHRPDENGRYPPPPLNGTAHTWHHSMEVLAQVIRKGTLEWGGSMPAWEETLDDDDVFSLIMYLSSLWPDEIYQAWLKRN